MTAEELISQYKAGERDFKEVFLGRVNRRWPNILIRSLSGQSPKGVIDSEWLIVERMYFFGRDNVRVQPS